MPVGGGNYEAKYEKDPIIRVVASGQGIVKIDENNKTSYCCKKGTSVKVVATPKSGYYFAGWSDGGSASHWVTVNSDITITATFKPLYSITVTSGGGGTVSGGGSSLKSDTTTTIKATPNTGYHFVKWQKSTNGGKNYSDVSWSAEYLFTVSGNAIYKAIFEANTYTVTLDSNGGNLKSVTSYSVKYNGSTGDLPKPVKQGWRFKGWTYNGKTYSYGSKVNGVTSNMTLVAKWSKCSGHVWGRCGVNHTATKPYVLSQHSSSHKTTHFQCSVCIECGAFDGGICDCNNFTKNLNKNRISAVHLCTNEGGCRNSWSRKRSVYNIHDEIGLP